MPGQGQLVTSAESVGRGQASEGAGSVSSEASKRGHTLLSATHMRTHSSHPRTTEEETVT